MDIGLFIWITVAVFAVFGLCCLLKLTADAYIFPGKYTVAVICDDKTCPEDIGFLVNRAQSSWFGRKGNKTIVLIQRGLKIPEEIVTSLQESNINIYRITAYPGTDKEKYN